VSDILSALGDVAQANPEKAGQLLDDLKAKWDSMTPEEQEQAKAKLMELKDKVASMSPEQQAAIADKIRGIAGV